MELVLRFTLAATLIVGSVALVGFTQPEWATSLGLDFWRLPEYQQRLEKEKDRESRIDKESSLVQDRSRRKDQLVRELIAGQINLVEATRETIALSDERFFTTGLESLHAEGTNLPEKVARAILVWVNLEFAGTDQDKAECLARLGEELAHSRPDLARLESEVLVRHDY